jgi:hypothetical protein
MYEYYFFDGHHKVEGVMLCYGNAYGHMPQHGSLLQLSEVLFSAMRRRVLESRADTGLEGSWGRLQRGRGTLGRAMEGTIL